MISHRKPIAFYSVMDAVNAWNIETVWPINDDTFSEKRDISIKTDTIILHP